MMLAIDKRRVEGLQRYENSLESLEKAESLIKVAGSFELHDVTAEDFHKYLVTVGDLLDEVREGFLELKKFIMGNDKETR